MRVIFERSGGFAGRKLQTMLDSTTLTEAQAQTLRQLLERSNFFDLPARLDARAPGADRFNYKVTVENEGESHTVEASDASVPPQLRPLLDWLTRSISVK